MEYTFVDLWHRETREILKDCTILKFNGSKNSYILQLSSGQHLVLVLNAHNPLCFITEYFQTETEDDTPLMLLMKQHLVKGRITNIWLLENDRVIFLEIEKENFYNEVQTYTLIFECIPRYENLILTRQNKTGQIILDCHKRIHESDSSFRQLYPGILYAVPPKIKKPYIFAFEKEMFIDFFGKTLPDNWKDFVGSFSNTPKFVKELFKPLMSTDEMWELLSIIRHRIKKWSQTDALYYHRVKRYVSLFKAEGTMVFPSVNDLFHHLFLHEILGYRFNQLKRELLSDLRKQLKKIKRTLVRQKKDQKSFDNAEEWKKYGELLKTNLHLVKDGMDTVQVIDYYTDTQKEIEIPLNSDFSPQKNMEQYFRKYKKAVSGREKLEKNVQQNEERILKLENRIAAIETCKTIDELQSYKKSNRESKKGKRTTPFKRISLEVYGKEWDLFIGRSGKENDELTLHYSKPDDWFFHTRIYHGAHVVVRNPEKRKSLPEKIMAIAAGLAAYFSKAKHATKVPVDYTQIRYVTKPRKSAPGFVIYRNNKTLFVDPIDPRTLIQ